MAVTRLKRKGKKNRVVSKLRIQNMKLLAARPVISNVDIEAIKEEFKAKAAAEATPKAKKATKAEKEASEATATAE